MGQFFLFQVSEPKFKLNRKDESRWRDLVRRHALGISTADESAELEKLQRQRRHRIHNHPQIKAEVRRTRRLIRRAQALRLMVEQAAELEKLQRRRLLMLKR